MSHIDDSLSSTLILIIYTIPSNTTTYLTSSYHFIPGKFRSLRSPSLRSSYGSLRSHYITTTNRPRFARTTVTTTTTLALLALATLDLASLVSNYRRPACGLVRRRALVYPIPRFKARALRIRSTQNFFGPLEPVYHILKTLNYFTWSLNLQTSGTLL